MIMRHKSQFYYFTALGDATGTAYTIFRCRVTPQCFSYVAHWSGGAVSAVVSASEFIVSLDKKHYTTSEQLSLYPGV